MRAKTLVKSTPDEQQLKNKTLAVGLDAALQVN